MRRSAFTLIELLTVIAIIGILASLTGYVYSSSLIRSRDAERKTALDTIKNALEQYYLDHRRYVPLADNVSLTAKLQLEYSLSQCPSGSNKDYLVPIYLANIPEDPKNRFKTESCLQSVFGQYLYLPDLALVGGRSNLTPHRYFLGARMEFFNSPAGFNLIAGYQYPYENQSYSPCSNIQVACSHNYFIKQSKND